MMDFVTNVNEEDEVVDMDEERKQKKWRVMASRSKCCARRRMGELTSTAHHINTRPLTMMSTIQSSGAAALKHLEQLRHH